MTTVILYVHVTMVAHVNQRQDVVYVLQVYRENSARMDVLRVTMEKTVTNPVKDLVSVVVVTEFMATVYVTVASLVLSVI